MNLRQSKNAQPKINILDILDHNDIRELNLYFHESSIHPQVFGRLKLLSQQIKSFNKKSSKSVAYVPAYNAPNYQNNSYSIPQNPRSYQYQQRQSHHVPAQDNYLHNEVQRTNYNNDQYKMPIPPPPPPPTDFNYNSKFQNHQSSYTQESSFPNEFKDNNAQSNYTRPMPEIAFKELNHVYRSQKRQMPRPNDQIKAKPQPPSFETKPNIQIDFKSTPRLPPPPPPKTKELKKSSSSFLDLVSEYPKSEILGKRNDKTFESPKPEVIISYKKNKVSKIPEIKGKPISELT